MDPIVNEDNQQAGRSEGRGKPAAASAEGRLRIAPGACSTFAQFGESFLCGIGHANTKRRYTSSFNMLRLKFGEMKLNAITGTGIDDYVASRRAAGTRSATISRDLAFLRCVFKAARRKRLIFDNPIEEVQFLEERKGRRKPSILSYDDEERLAAAAPLRALVVLLIETGLRVGCEALALRWDDVDFDAMTVQVRESKTDAGRRKVPLTARCTDELRQWLKATGGTPFSPGVFPNLETPARHVTTMRRAWKTAVERAKLRPFRIYDRRAVFASRMLAVGQADLFVAQMLGHSSASILHTYAKAVTDFQREAVQKMEALRKRASTNQAAAAQE